MKWYDKVCACWDMYYVLFEGILKVRKSISHIGSHRQASAAFGTTPYSPGLFCSLVVRGCLLLAGLGESDHRRAWADGLLPIHHSVCGKGVVVGLVQ